MAEAKKNEVATQDTAVSEKRNKVTDFSLGIFGTSDNFIMACQMAKALAGSTLVPTEYRGNESNCLIAVDIALRLKTSPFLVMQELDVIQGRPAWRAKALIGMINASGKYDFELQFEEKNDSKGKPYSCKCWTEKRGRKITGPVIDMQMADDEGWTKKNGTKWKTMPQVMLRYRAASFFSRMNCPEISMGIYTSEEIIDGDFREISVESLAEQVQNEIAQNANSVPFELAQIEEKQLPPQMPKAAEKEPVAVGTGNQSEMPDFMRPE